jgi:cellulose synthase/poly-beta-1,6-N-acetylglucosamine synthase-like glycosyltransferase
VLFIFGSHGHHDLLLPEVSLQEEPGRAGIHASVVTVQLPVYNALYVVGRHIDAACAMVYPKEKLEIQVLDDSTDQTVDVVARHVEKYRRQGYDIKQIRRANRAGYKARALKAGACRCPN